MMRPVPVSRTGAKASRIGTFRYRTCSCSSPSGKPNSTTSWPWCAALLAAVGGKVLPMTAFSLLKMIVSPIQILKATIGLCVEAGDNNFSSSSRVSADNLGEREFLDAWLDEAVQIQGCFGYGPVDRGFPDVMGHDQPEVSHTAKDAR